MNLAYHKLFDSMLKNIYSFHNSIIDIKANYGTSSSLLLDIPGGVLGISSDGDDRRIFLGLKFSIPGFF